MKIEKAYKNQDNSDEIIYQLENGWKIIRRSNDTIKKFNLNRWDYINFLPEDFQEISYKITPEEERELKVFLNNEKNKIWYKIKKFLSFR